MDWGKIWEDIRGFFMNNYWNLILFVAVLIFGIIIIKIIMRIIKKILNKTKMEKIAQNFLCTSLKLVLYLVLVLALLSIIGIQITGIITALSALLLAVGMALEANIANLANGIVIVSTHMFKKGDYIIVDGVEGSITEINFLFTTLLTVDNKKITMPNSKIVNSSVTNAGANPKRRVDFTFAVAYESDVELVKKTVVDVMTSDGRVYLDPAPFCRLKTMNESSLDFFANCWVDSEDYWDVYYYVMENVYNEFKRNKISVPYNQLEIRERKDNVKVPVVGKKLPERVEKIREEEQKRFDIESSSLSEIFAKGKKKGKKKRKEEKVTAEKKNKEEAKATEKEVEETKKEVKTEKTVKTTKKENNPEKNVKENKKEKAVKETAQKKTKKNAKK